MSTPEETTQIEPVELTDEQRAERGDIIEDELGDSATIAKIAGDDSAADAGKATEEAAAAAASSAEDGEAVDKQEAVPHAKFHAMNERRKAAEAENLRLQEIVQNLSRAAAAGKPSDAADTEGKAAADEPAKVDVRALRRQAKEALIEGDLDKADELDAQADAEVQRLAEERAMQRLASNEAVSKIESTVQTIYADYPLLDPANEAKDMDAITDVVDLRDVYMQKRGMKAPEAIKAAVEFVAKARGWNKAEASAAAIDKEGDGKPVDKRTEKAVQRAAEESGKQIPDKESMVGNRSGTLRASDVEKMGDKEFSSLSEEEKSRLRGDIL